MSEATECCRDEDSETRDCHHLDCVSMMMMMRIRMMMRMMMGRRRRKMRMRMTLTESVAETGDSET